MTYSIVIDAVGDDRGALAAQEVHGPVGFGRVETDPKGRRSAVPPSGRPPDGFGRQTGGRAPGRVPPSVSGAHGARIGA